MKILFVTSECAPYSKSGGLADVAFSLPPALKKAGNEVEIITPYYKCAKERFADQVEYVGNTFIRLGDAEMYCGLFRGLLSGVPVWFVDNEELFYGKISRIIELSLMECERVYPIFNAVMRQNVEPSQALYAGMVM